MEKDDNNAKPIVKNCLAVEKSFSLNSLFQDRSFIKHQIYNNQYYKLILENNPSLKLYKTNYVVASSAEFVSGYFAACISIILLFPLNKLIFRQILEGISFKDAFKQLKSEGINQTYRGLLPPLLQKSASYSIMFGTQHEYYIRLKNWSKSSKSNYIGSLEPQKRRLLLTSVSAGLAGLTEATLTPFERVQAVLQVQKFHQSYTNTWHVFQEISKTHGLKELYRGYSAICLRNSLSNVVFFTSRTPLKAMFPKADNKLKNTVYDFISGGVLGACISTIFYPVNVIKSHMQVIIGGSYLNMYQAFKLIHESRDRRFSKLYKGVGSNFARAILAWGIINSSYEFFLSKLANPSDGSSLD